MTTQPIEVVGAVIERDEHVLCALRSPRSSLPNVWEFPGGKVETGESHAVALQREIVEELGCEITVLTHLTTTTHVEGARAVRLHTYRCAVVSGHPMAHEHAEIRWVTVQDLMTLRWAPADIEAVNLLAGRSETPSARPAR